MSTWSWQRIGAIAGVLWFLTILITLFLPETPDADDPTAQIVTELVDDETGLSVGAWVLALGAVLFMVFTTALWSRLRAAEREPGPAALVLLGGVAAAVVIFVSAMVSKALVEAAANGREPEAIRALFELDELMFVAVIFTSIPFYAGIAFCERGVRTLPAWMGISAAVLTAGFAVGSIGLASTAEDGGFFGGLAFLCIVLNFFWVLAASVVMLRDGSPGDREQVPVVAP